MLGYSQAKLSVGNRALIVALFKVLTFDKSFLINGFLTLWVAWNDGI